VPSIENADDLKLLTDLVSVLKAREKRLCQLLSGAPPDHENQATLQDAHLETVNSTLDVQGMMALMLEVQRESLTANGDTKAQLVASASQLVACGSAKAAANTSSFELTAAVAQAAHSSCRASEQMLLADQRAKYQMLNATWQGFVAPACSADMEIADPWPSRLACFGDVQFWLETSAANMQTQLTAWVASLHAEHNKTNDCNALQQDFEASFCKWTETQDATCTAYETCFESALAQHVQLVSHANNTEHLSKADYVAAEQVLCSLQVFNAGSAAEKEEAMALCDSQVVNTTRLDMTYPELVAKDTCLVPVDYPCMASWWGQTYANASWYGAVQLLPCSPCSTTTSTTTSTTNIALPLVYAGHSHSSAIANGKAYTWGRPNGLGDGSTSARSSPMEVMDGVTSGAVRWSTYVVKEDAEGLGRVWATGENNWGHLAIGSTQDQSSFVESMSTGDVVKVAAGYWHAVMLNRQGEAWAVGRNKEGQLGNGRTSTTAQTTPLKVMENVVEICAGDYHTFVVASDGGAYAFGHNHKGQLGDGSTNVQSSPTLVLENVASCDSHRHTLFLKRDGTVWATGWNEYGQLGDGTREDRNTPVQVMQGVRSVSAGLYVSMFLKEDGTLWATGSNAYGEFGDGTTTASDIPVQVMSSVAQVSAGSFHALFVKEDGTVWSSGRNQFGQLGVDPIGPDFSTPAQVALDGN